jgi:hypothetical protein
MQDYPDQPTKPMGDCPNGLIVSQAWYEAAIHDLEDASFRPDRSVGALIENAPHLAVALGGAVVRRYSRAIFISQGTLPPRKTTASCEANVAAWAPTSAMICCAEATPSAWWTFSGGR